jgi:hypothetical protein
MRKNGERQPSGFNRGGGSWVCESDSVGVYYGFWVYHEFIQKNFRGRGSRMSDQKMSNPASRF